MSTPKRVPVICAILVLILSFTPSIYAQAQVVAATARALDWYDAAKNFYSLFKLGINIAKDVADELGDLGILNGGDQGRPANNPNALAYGFSTTYTVNKHQVNALIDINSPLTWINNDASSDFLCCRPNGGYNCPYIPSSSQQCYRYQGSCLAATGAFIFRPNGPAAQCILWSPSSDGVNNQITTATGVLGFRRNSANSILSQFQYHRFSYYFTLTGGSTIDFGVQPNIIPARNLQSVQLLRNQNNQGYENLYYVPAPQISVGSRALLNINPAIDFYNGVIIDTSIPYILLATNAYSKVVTELQSQIGRKPVDTDTGMICFGNTPNWPPLTLSFQSGYAKMVLNKDNYVVSDSQTECAAIYESKYISVIGIIAQLDRQMIFDVDKSILYFDPYPKNGLSGVTRPTITFVLGVIYFIFSILG